VQIKFIGTGSGKTSLNRFHSSLLISSENYNLLIDAGDGISKALLFNKINYSSIDGIIFTHLHPDHFCGLPSLVVQMKMMNRKKPLNIYIQSDLKDVVEKFLLYTYLLPERMMFAINYHTFIEDNRIALTEKFSILARKNLHLNKLVEYSTVYPSLKFESYSLLFEVAGKKIVFTADIGSKADLYLFNDIPSDIFITETTHIEPEILIGELLKIDVGKIILTHISDESLSVLNEIMATLQLHQKNRIVIANDALSLEI